jgi:hypothetical protein
MVEIMLMALILVTLIASTVAVLMMFLYGAFR